MAPIRVLGDAQFQALTMEQKYLYINEMLHCIVASRPRSRGHGQPVGQHMEYVAQQLTDADYARLSDAQKISYLENLIGDLVRTVAEAQRALRTLRTGSG